TITSVPTVSESTPSSTITSVPTVSESTSSSTITSIPTASGSTTSSTITSIPTVSESTTSSTITSIPTVSGSTSSSTITSIPTASGSTTSSTSTPVTTTFASTPTTIPTVSSTTPSLTTTTTNPTTTPVITTTSLLLETCLNGGTWDGNKCICVDGFSGSLCEYPICQNGGTWEGGLCYCLPNFQGNECQLVKENIEINDVNQCSQDFFWPGEVVVNATVEMKAKVTNQIFTEDLRNRSSPAFQDFEEKFKDQMDVLYKNILGYQGVVVLNLTEGSIVVDYKVILKIPVTSTLNSTTESIVKDLVSIINTSDTCCETDPSLCSFCFNSTFTNVTSYTVDDVDEDLCDGQVPEEFKDQYSVVLTKDGVICATRCDQRVANPYTCTHGTCYVDRSGPLCECSDQAAFWYMDKTCSSRLSKVGVAVGVPVAVLVIATTVFTIFLIRTQRKNTEYREKLSSRSELYDDEDENWSSPHGFGTSNQAASWEGSETPNVYISLENVDTSRQIRIQKPSSILP
ncbi:PREDICTED: mucin-3B-like, partial [Tinamus guttatus]|uniref:mucin-3B-like n=1 Tax=Tinamus guttatus TaxID=94827 RepID=UPI00052F1380